MELSLERTIVHNPALGALSLWSFSREYIDFGKNDLGPSLPMTMLVLPLVLHRQSMLNIRRMRKASGLLKAVSEHPELAVNLQERIEWFSDLTFSSLLLACSTPLLSVERGVDWPHFFPKRKGLPEELQPVADDIKGTLSAARRLGAWLSQIEFGIACSLLHVQF
jgi:hypothetical protein